MVIKKDKLINWEEWKKWSKKKKEGFLHRLKFNSLSEIPEKILEEIMADVDLRLALIESHHIPKRDFKIVKKYFIRGNVGAITCRKLIAAFDKKERDELRIILFLSRPDLYKIAEKECKKLDKIMLNYKNKLK
ncbi:MAG: hypothetical protein ABIK77_03340 [candidate division WOR-3 bacterium]